MADGALDFGKQPAKSNRNARGALPSAQTANASLSCRRASSLKPNARKISGWLELWMTKAKIAAKLAFDASIESCALRNDKMADCLSKDRDTLLAFYGFPAEHWNTCG